MGHQRAVEVWSGGGTWSGSRGGARRRGTAGAARWATRHGRRRERFVYLLISRPRRSKRPPAVKGAAAAGRPVRSARSEDSGRCRVGISLVSGGDGVAPPFLGLPHRDNDRSRRVVRPDLVEHPTRVATRGVEPTVVRPAPVDRKGVDTLAAGLVQFCVVASTARVDRPRKHMDGRVAPEPIQTLGDRRAQRNLDAVVHARKCIHPNILDGRQSRRLERDAERRDHRL